MIGVYDSGFGGLSVLRELRRVLAHHSFVYLGDSGRAPYGGRNADTVLDFAEQCVERLFEEGCRLIVVACHTVSCVGLRHLQQRYVAGRLRDRRILGVTIPAAEAAVRHSQGHVGVIGTARTIASCTFEMEVHKLRNLRVSGVAAPLLAPIVEEGWETTDIAQSAVDKYVQRFGDIDTLVLACTHYPLLMDAFQRAIKARRRPVRILDPSPFVAERLVDWLRRHPHFDTQPTTSQGSLRCLCSGDPDVFRAEGQRFLGTPLSTVQHIAEEHGRFTVRDSVLVRQGQVMR